MWQWVDSEAEPEQAWPPCAGEGLSHFRSRERLPPPHGALHLGLRVGLHAMALRTVGASDKVERVREPAARDDAPPSEGDGDGPAIGVATAAPKTKRRRLSHYTADEVLLCCHKMPHEGGCFTCTLPFGHLCPHETGPVGPRKRAPARSREL